MKFLSTIGVKSDPSGWASNIGYQLYMHTYVLFIDMYISKPWMAPMKTMY